MKRFLLVLGLLFGLLSPAWAVVSQTTVGDVAYSITTNDQRVVTTAAFSAARTWTLPSAGGSAIGQTQGFPTSLEVLDLAGAITNTNTLTIAPASGETINGSSASIVLASPRGRVVLVPTSGTNWFAVVQTSGQVPGTATNDNAGVGFVGEYVTSTITTPGSGGSVLATGTAKDVTNVSVSAGDWDCRGNVSLVVATTTTATIFAAWTSSGSATFPGIGNDLSGSLQQIQVASVTNPAWILAVTQARYSFSVASSVFLSTRATFATAAASGYGFLGCRRVR